MVGRSCEWGRPFLFKVANFGIFERTRMKIPFTNIEITLGNQTRHVETAPVERVDLSITQEPFAKKPSDLPVKGGRVSYPNDVNLYTALIDAFSTVEPDYPVELVKVLTNLAMYNADVSYAVSNIIQLGNTPYKIYFDDKISEAVQKKAAAFLTTRNKQLYRGGINSLINDLLAQIAITGAVSGENVLMETLEDVKKVVLVTVSDIRFIYDEKASDFIPYQRPRGVLATNTNGLIRLNENTYKYYPLQRFNEKPYAVPPFLAALESIEVERAMVNNMKNIVQKVGAFGFLTILVNAPQKKQGEDETAFKARCAAYLQEVYTQSESGFNKGMVIGFKDTHQFKVEGAANNVDGARELFNLISEMKMSGLKQDPLMLGRNFNVAETMARVILAKLATMITNYQKLVANFLEDLFLLRLQLAGFPIDEVVVEFDAPMLSDRAKEEEAYGKQIDNNIKLYKQGIIDQQDFAQAVGYDEPAEKEPRAPVIDPAAAKGPNADNPDDPTATGDVTDPKTTDQKNIKYDIAVLEVGMGKDGREYPYKAEGRYKKFKLSLMWEFDDKMMDKAYRKYFGETADNFDTASKKAVKDIAKNLAKLEEGYTAEQVVDNIMYNLYKTWNREFTPAQKKITARNIKDAYTEMRKSDEYFKGLGIKVPEAVFNLNDVRAVEYFKNSDTHYLGKFITDEDVKKRVTKYIKENYLENDMPIGKNKAAIAKFQAEFGDVIALQEWKLEQILTTTVNKMRNTAAVHYIDQAEVTKYKIVGVPDSHQSNFCKAIHGKTFDVQTTVTAMATQYSSDPSQISQVSPFGVSLVDAEKVKGMPADELQALGIGTPPYHPNCRTRIVAIL